MKKIISILVCYVMLFWACDGSIIRAEDNTDIYVSAVDDGDCITVDVLLSENDIDGVAYVALMFGDEVVDVSFKHTDEYLQFVFDDGSWGNKVKVFLWESLQSMKPLCDIITADVIVNKFYGKKLYVDGDSVAAGADCSYGKIISENHGMQLVSNARHSAMISNMSIIDAVKYGAEMDWENTKYYLKLFEYNPIDNTDMISFAFPLTRELYKNGFGNYPELYKMKNGVMTQCEPLEELPMGKFYVKFKVPTYDGNYVEKYHTIWQYKDREGNIKGNTWLWEAYKNGFENVHKNGNAIVGTARHWLCDSVRQIDKTADYVILEGGIGEYEMNRRIGKISENDSDPLDTTTTIGAMEYICRVLKDKHSHQNIIFLFIHRANNFVNVPNPGYSSTNATWQDYHDAIISVLKKYEIEYVDLFETEFDTSKEEYLQYTRNLDGVHPNKEGYEKFYVPYIVEAMREQYTGENQIYGKTLYVDGDSICFGNGYTGGYAKIIADKYGMTLMNAGVGGATISKGSSDWVKYGVDMDWDNMKYYLRLPSYDPFKDKNTESFVCAITKEQYENGFGVYPTAYVMDNGTLTALEYTDEMPWGRFYIKFDIPTYGDNTVSKYYRMWHFIDENGNESGNTWLWHAYKNGFEKYHQSGDAQIGVERHWLCDSVHEIDKNADYVILEGGINEYFMDRPIGKLSENETELLDTTTTIGAMEYICRVLKEQHSHQKIVYLVVHKAKNYVNNPLSGYSSTGATWQDYHDAIISVLKKYEIEYVDLFETEFDTSKEEYLQYTRNLDGVHPTKEGYEKFYVPYIVEAMKK